MRNYLAAVGLFVLSACGSDVTTPGGQFTLTVAGSGSGTGKVQTSAGIQPALDCTIANAQPTGTCSVKYSEGTTVGLTVAADASSTFDGWSGDASSCTTEPTCSITMTENKSVVAQFSGTSSAVQVASSTYFPDPSFGGQGAVVWAVEVKNTTNRVVEEAQINFTSHDASGTVLASDFTFVGPIPPGETRASQSYAAYHGTEASVDIKVGEVQFATEPLDLSSAQITSSNWHADPTFDGQGAVVWTVEVLNTSNAPLESVEVDFVTYDASGKILTVDATFVGPIAPGERESSEGNADYHGTEASAKFQVANVTVSQP
jgi:List-Bact-rpt repeat protein